MLSVHLDSHQSLAQNWLLHCVQLCGYGCVILWSEWLVTVLLVSVDSYPLILSIENHCSQPQQTKMAYGFMDVFGDMLLTEPVSTPSGTLPSPTQLKRKIIIKVSYGGSCWLSGNDQLTSHHIEPCEHKCFSKLQKMALMVFGWWTGYADGPAVAKTWRP